jgi:hypothetical protein
VDGIIPAWHGPWTWLPVLSEYREIVTATSAVEIKNWKSVRPSRLRNVRRGWALTSTLPRTGSSEIDITQYQIL